MSESTRTIPSDKISGLRSLVQYLIEHLGEIKLDELDSLDFIINKIDDETIFIQDNKIKAAVNVKKNSKYIFTYGNSNYPTRPTKLEIYNLATNELKSKLDYEFTPEGLVTSEKTYDSNNVLTSEVSLTYATIDGKKVITEISSDIV